MVVIAIQRNRAKKHSLSPFTHIFHFLEKLRVNSLIFHSYLSLKQQLTRTKENFSKQKIADLDIFSVHSKLFNTIIPTSKKYPGSSVTEEDGAGLSSIYATEERKGCKNPKMYEKVR